MGERVRTMGAPNPYVAEIVAALGLSPTEVLEITTDISVDDYSIRKAVFDHRQKSVKYRWSCQAGKLTAAERESILDVWRDTRSRKLIKLADAMERAWGMGAMDRINRNESRQQFMIQCEGFNARILEPIIPAEEKTKEEIERECGIGEDDYEAF